MSDRCMGWMTQAGLTTDPASCFGLERRAVLVVAYRGRLMPFLSSARALPLLYFHGQHPRVFWLAFGVYGICRMC